MKSLDKHSAFTIVLVSLLLCLLLVLAGLQYWWLEQLSEADEEQMRSILKASADRFSIDLDRELSGIYSCFLPYRGPIGITQDDYFAERYIRWASTAPYPGMVKDIYRMEGSQVQNGVILKLDHRSRRFEPSGIPVELAKLERELRDTTARFQEPPSRREPDAMPPGDRGRNPRIQTVRAKPLSLVIPVFSPPEFHSGGVISIRAAPGFVVAVLDSAYIRETVLPALASRHFPEGSKFNYQITILSRDTPGENVFATASTDKSPALPALSDADLTIGLFGVRMSGEPPAMPDRMPGEGTGFRPGSATPDDSPGRGGFAPRPFEKGAGPEMLGGRPFAGNEGLWLMLIRHREGSLSAVVTKTRYRNLGLSFGILLVLGASVAMIIALSRRARRLANQQMEFVAGVSHELRTPVAVICSAGENLADGVILETSQVTHYGKLIRDEGRRLAAMIEQVLDFASARGNRLPGADQKLAVEEMLAGILRACRPEIEAAGFDLQQDFQPGLPPVKGNEAALSRAIQNLLSNAMKYSGPSRWIRLSADQHSGRRGREIRITVEDRGMGVAPKDLPYIFEPFFRGSEAAGAQIRGNGLGLAIVRSIVDAHGGKVTVDSAPGRGSRFSIHLPAAPEES